MRATFGALMVAIGLAGPSIALAQRPLQIPVQFDFINPGARSLALGGAFTGSQTMPPRRSRIRPD